MIRKGRIRKAECGSTHNMAIRVPLRHVVMAFLAILPQQILSQSLGIESIA